LGHGKWAASAKWQWASNGQAMGKQWASNGQAMSKQWASNGQAMGCECKCSGRRLGHGKWARPLSAAAWARAHMRRRRLHVQEVHAAEQRCHLCAPLQCSWGPCWAASSLPCGSATLGHHRASPRTGQRRPAVGWLPPGFPARTPTRVACGMCRGATVLRA